jgi:WD40 repeat protein
MVASGVNTLSGCEPGEKQLEEGKKQPSSDSAFEQDLKWLKLNQTEIGKKLAEIRQEIAQLRLNLSTVISKPNQFESHLLGNNKNPVFDVRQFLKDYDFNKQNKCKEIAHSGYIASVKFSNDNRFIFIGDVKGGISKWNTEGPDPVKLFGKNSEQDKSLGFVVFGSDDKSALIGVSDWKGLGVADKACYLNLDNPKVEVALKGYTHNYTAPLHSPQAMAISFDCSYALTRSDIYTASYWSLKTGELLKILKGHKDTVTSVAFTLDGKYALAGSNDGTVCLWDLTQDGKEIKPSKTFDSAAIGFMPALHAQIKAGKLKSDDEIYAAIKLTKSVTCLAVSCDSKYVLSGSEDGTACLWDINTGDKIRLLCNNAPVDSVALLPDGKHALTGSAGKICLWNLSGTLPKCDYPSLTLNNGGIISWLEVSSDGKLLAAACSNREVVHLYDLQSIIEIAYI